MSSLYGSTAYRAPVGAPSAALLGTSSAAAGLARSSSPYSSTSYPSGSLATGGGYGAAAAPARPGTPGSGRYDAWVLEELPYGSTTYLLDRATNYVYTVGAPDGWWGDKARKGAIGVGEKDTSYVYYSLGRGKGRSCPMASPPTCSTGPPTTSTRWAPPLP